MTEVGYRSLMQRVRRRAKKDGCTIRTVRNHTTGGDTAYYVFDGHNSHVGNPIPLESLTARFGVDMLKFNY